MTSKEAIEKAIACMEEAERTGDLRRKMAMALMAEAYCEIAKNSIFPWAK